MTMVRADIESILVGAGPISSLLVLKPRAKKTMGQSSAPSKPLPIRIGSADAANIGMALGRKKHKRPMTFDLMADLLKTMGLTVESAAITDVEGTTFYARIDLTQKDGTSLAIDARPSDAIALALKARAPFYVDEKVLETASLPDFDKIKEQQNQANLQEFEKFIQTIKPEDFD